MILALGSDWTSTHYDETTFVRRHRNSLRLDIYIEYMVIDIQVHSRRCRSCCEHSGKVMPRLQLKQI